MSERTGSRKRSRVADTTDVAPSEIQQGVAAPPARVQTSENGQPHAPTQPVRQVDRVVGQPRRTITRPDDEDEVLDLSAVAEPPIDLSTAPATAAPRRQSARTHTHTHTSTAPPTAAGKRRAPHQRTEIDRESTSVQAVAARGSAMNAHVPSGGAHTHTRARARAQAAEEVHQEHDNDSGDESWVGSIDSSSDDDVESAAPADDLSENGRGGGGEGRGGRGQGGRGGRGGRAGGVGAEGEDEDVSVAEYVSEGEWRFDDDDDDDDEDEYWRQYDRENGEEWEESDEDEDEDEDEDGPPLLTYVGALFSADAVGRLHSLPYRAITSDDYHALLTLDQLHAATLRGAASSMRQRRQAAIDALPIVRVPAKGAAGARAARQAISDIVDLASPEPVSGTVDTRVVMRAAAQAASPIGGRHASGPDEELDLTQVVDSPAVVGEPAPGGAPASSPDDTDCAVCRDAMEAGCQVRIMPCMHRFHVDCIDPWLHMKTVCPICKTDVLQAVMQA